MTIQALSFVDKFLAGATRKTVRGNLIFGLDATASRERTWDMASHLQVKMFQEVASIGALDLQLVYFRGTTGANAECKASPWVGDPMQLARFMTGVRCIAGLTQIRRVLEHGLREASQKKINAMVYVGDHAEEMRDRDSRPRQGTRPARRAGLHVPGRPRPRSRARLPGDRNNDRRRLSEI